MAVLIVADRVSPKWVPAVVPGRGTLDSGSEIGFTDTLQADGRLEDESCRIVLAVPDNASR